MSELRSHFGFNNLPFTREIAINQCHTQEKFLLSKFPGLIIPKI